MKFILRIISGFIIGLVFLIPVSFSKTFPQLNTTYSDQFNFDNYSKISQNHNILQVENLIGTPIFITEEKSGEDKFYWYSTDKKILYLNMKK